MRIFIAIVTLLGLLAVAGPIVVGTMSFDGTVVDKPYEKALLYDETRRASSAWVLEVRNDAQKRGHAELIFALQGSDRELTAGRKVLLTISRPSTAAYDSTYTVSPASDGIFRTLVNFPVPGHWNMKVSFLHRGKEIALEKRLFVD